MDKETRYIRLFFAKIKPTFFELSESERMNFMSTDRQNLDDLGMKAVSMIQCAEFDDKWDYIGVESWPSMEAIEQRKDFEENVLQISKFVEYKTHLGVGESFDNYGKPT